jgi:hypothetical protein
MPARRQNEIEEAARDFKVRSSPALKVAVHADFASILGQLESLQRGPDAWEEAYMVQALSHMEAGLYERAQTAVRECVIPVGERSTWREDQIKRNPQRYSLAQLRRRFEIVKAGFV